MENIPTGGIHRDTNRPNFVGGPQYTPLKKHKNLPKTPLEIPRHSSRASYRAPNSANQKLSVSYRVAPKIR